MSEPGFVRGFLQQLSAAPLHPGGATRFIDFVCLLGVVGSFLFLGAALALGSPQLGRSAVMLFLACMSLLFVWKLLSELRAGDRLSIESHWGGFGNGLGGWRLSSSLVYLVAAISFGIIFAVSSLLFLDRMPGQQPGAEVSKPVARATAEPAKENPPPPAVSSAPAAAAESTTAEARP
jgi:hypothetical protein